MNIVVDDLLTTYTRQGSGKAIVLLHGWGDNAASFQDLQTFLSNKYNVISFDLPGFGKSQPPEGVWGLDDYSRFVAHALKKLGIDKPLAIIGHSNGGAIAIRGLGTGVLTADKLVLLSAAGIRSEYKGRKKILRLAAKTGKVLSAPLPPAVKKRLRKEAYEAIGSDMFVAEHLQDTFKKVVTDDVQADAANITIPTLIMYGENDEATPPRYGEAFYQAIKQSSLIVVSGAGHFLHHDKPRQVQEALGEFLDA